MKKNYLLRSMGLMMIAALAFISCSKSDDATAAATPPGSTTVVMKGMKFNPFELRVTTGAVVNWVNADTTVYSVTADDASYESGDIPAGGSYSRTFSVPGTYSYHSRHGFEMKGRIVVSNTP